MKYVFNIIILIVLILVFRAACDKEEVSGERQIYVAQNSKRSFYGAKLVKTIKNTLPQPIRIAADIDNDVLYIASEDSKNSGTIFKTELYGKVYDVLNIADTLKITGLTICKGNLFAAVGKTVIKYSLEEDSLIKKYEIPIAHSLCFLEKDNKGTVYALDNQAGCIFKINADTSEVFLKDSLCHESSTLCSDGTVLAGGVQNKIYIFDKKGATFFASLPSKLRGIRADRKGNYITTDSNGNIYAVSKDSVSVLLSKQDDKTGYADFEYIPQQKLLLQPFSFGMNIYELGKYFEKNTENEQ